MRVVLSRKVLFALKFHFVKVPLLLVWCTSFQNFFFAFRSIFDCIFIKNKKEIESCYAHCPTTSIFSHGIVFVGICRVTAYRSAVLLENCCLMFHCSHVA